MVKSAYSTLMVNDNEGLGLPVLSILEMSSLCAKKDAFLNNVQITSIVHPTMGRVKLRTFSLFLTQSFALSNSVESLCESIYSSASLF